MNDLVTDIKALKEETLKNLQSSKANNTVRAYKSDFKDFGLFCVQNGFKNLPSDPKTVSLYLTHLSTKEVKLSTIKRRLVSIGVIHKIKGHYLDTKHPVIVENLMGIKRRKGTIQRGKKPILINDLKKILDVIDQQNSEDIKKLRDKSIILIGFSGGFRRSELVNIYYEDVEFVSEGVKILIKRSKTDQSGEGVVKAIPYFDNQEFCPVISLKEYMKDKFEINKSGRIFEISDKSVALIIKRFAEKAGLDSSKYAGHSLRSGFATTAAEFGAEERNIMAMTGHRQLKW